MRAVQHTIDHLEQLEAAWEATRMQDNRLQQRMTALRGNAGAAAADHVPAPPPPAWRIPRFDAPAGALRPATPPAHADAMPSGRWASRAGDRLADAFISLLQAMPEAHGMAYELEREDGPMFWGPSMAGHSAQPLPLQLLLTDRDFDEHDYELLLALDETVENRKGAGLLDWQNWCIHKYVCSSGARAEQIAALPTRTLDEEQLASCSEPRCPICLEAHAVGAELRELPCGHAYHKGCVDTWLHHKSTCPVCTRDICQSSSRVAPS